MKKHTLLHLFLVILISTCLGCGQSKNKSSGPVVVLETTQGSIEIQLFPETAPKACENMIGLINEGFYDGITFHRVVKDWVIQAGDPTATGRGGKTIWGVPFDIEVNPFIKFDRPGLVGVANSGGRPNTNDSQFFITTVPAPKLDMKFTLFGEVIKGYSTVKKIEAVPTNELDRPLEDQKIIRAYIKE